MNENWKICLFKYFLISMSTDGMIRSGWGGDGRDGAKSSRTCRGFSLFGAGREFVGGCKRGCCRAATMRHHEVERGQAMLKRNGRDMEGLFIISIGINQTNTRFAGLLRNRSI